MSLPSALQSYVTTRRFWTDFLWITDAEHTQGQDPYPLLKDFQFRFSVADGFEVSISLDQALCFTGLDFAVPGKDSQNIAWDDQAHWHPHVLRWSELDLLCQCVAARDPSLAHPGYPLLFLHRFAPICVGDDIDQIVALLETAWRKLDLFSSAEITTFIERFDARDADFHWRFEAGKGWCIEQEDDSASRGLYSLRTAENDEFPFADWEKLIDAAEQLPKVAAEVLPPPRCFPRKKHSLHLTIPHQDKDRPVPVPFMRLLNLTVDRMLCDLQWGHSEPGGGMSSPNGDGTYTEIESMNYLHLKGDLNASLDLLRGLLWWSKAPASVRLSEGYSEPIEWDLTQPGTNVPLAIQLGKLITYRWKSGYRFDPVSLKKAFQEYLRDLFAQADVIGPDEDGWYDLRLPDEGQLSICAKQLDGEDKWFGLTVIINYLTEDVSAWVYRAMNEHDLLLLPAVIATSDKVAQQIDAPWPEVSIVSNAKQLHQILTDGPYAWWKQ